MVILTFFTGLCLALGKRVKCFCITAAQWPAVTSEWIWAMAPWGTNFALCLLPRRTSDTTH